MPENGPKYNELLSLLKKKKKKKKKHSSWEERGWEMPRPQNASVLSFGGETSYVYFRKSWAGNQPTVKGRRQRFSRNKGSMIVATTEHPWPFLSWKSINCQASGLSPLSRALPEGENQAASVVTTPRTLHAQSFSRRLWSSLYTHTHTRARARITKV